MSTVPARLVLANVPQVKFYDGGRRCPEDICLPSALRALTEYLGDPDYGCNKCRAMNPNCLIGCTYSYFAGVTGAAFYLSWKDGWHEDNQSHAYLDADPNAMERRAFQALGYSFERLLPDQRPQFAPRVEQSLQRGLPVISYGIFGPPEAGLITGYDEDGEVVLGWDFFQRLTPGVETEPSGYYRRRDWAKHAQSLVIVGEKGSRPPLKETYRAALEFALKVIRTPMVRPGPDAPEAYQHRHNGLAAYDAWAAHLLRDDDFPAGDEKTLRQRFAVHDGVVGLVAEARWYGSQFLLGMADQVDTQVHRDALEGILHAAALYAGDHELMWKLWDFAGGLGNPDGWRLFADPTVRRQMVLLIQDVRDKDARAALHLEQALTRWH